MKSLTYSGTTQNNEGQALWRYAQGFKGKVSAFSKEIGVGRTLLYEYFKMPQLPEGALANILEKLKITEPELFAESVHPIGDLKRVNRKPDATRALYTNRYGVRFEPLSDGTYRAYHKKVSEAAHAAAPAGWGDPEYMSALPEQTTIVNEISEDNYATFAVIGDCQDDNSKEAISAGDEITGRSYSRSLWQYRLPYEMPHPKKIAQVKAGGKEIKLPEKNKRYKNWVMVDRHKGIRVAVIRDQDVEKGILYCTCRNPDKKRYPDFEIHLDDCAQIFHVVAVKTTF